MVERAFIQYIIPDILDPNIEIKEPYFKINWFSRHPGDEIEAQINTILKKQTQEGENDLFHLITFNGSYILIKWIAKVKAGLSILLHVFGDNKTFIPISEWSKYVWEFYKVKVGSVEELSRFHNDLKMDSDEISKLALSPVWIKASLNGDKVTVPMGSRYEFLPMMNLVLSSLPWTVYLLDYGTIINDSLELKYRKAKGSINIPMEELFSKLQNSNPEFWTQLQIGMTNILHLRPEDRSNKMLTYIGLILVMQKKEKLEPLESLELIANQVEDMLTLGLESSVTFITNTFRQVSVNHPTYDTCKRLLKVADKIQKKNQTDLIKLAEGTALQIAFSLNELKKREEIFLEVTKRSKKWGSSHLIAYIQSVTGILRETEENKKILSNIVQSCEDMLRNSWDGQLCLVESYLIADEINKAIITRLEASNHLTDKIMRAEDIFGAITWTLSQSVKEQDLIDLTSNAINQAILDVPKDQILLTLMEGLVNACLENSKLHFLFNLINLVNATQLGLDLDERMQLITLFEQMLSISKKYLQISIHVQLNKFNLFVENPAIYSFDAAEDLLRSIYNSINPTKSNAVELITHITNWIMLSSAKVNRLDLIDEARMRFDLLVNDEEYSRISLRDIYARAGRIRQKIPKGQLKRNGLGVKLFNEAIELTHPFKESDFLLDILPDAKSLAVKKQAYDIFVRFSILEITLAQHLGNDWMEPLLESTDVLVDNGALEPTRELFNHAMSQELDQDQHLKLLTKQLSYVEIEPDLFSAHEIYEKRNLLINLKSGVIDKKTQDELLDHYRFGVSELMSKGDIDHLSDLVIQAVKYCITNQLSALTEFSNILQDNFTNLLDNYQENKSSRAYKSLLSLLRKTNDSLIKLDLYHTIQFSSSLIRANIELYQSTNHTMYLQRMKTLLRELAIAIQEGIKSNLEIKPESYEVLIFDVNRALQIVDKSNDLFGKIEAMNLAAFFFYNIGDTNSVFNYLTDTLAHLKKEIIKTKKITSTAVVGLLILSEIYLKIEADIISELCTPLQQHALRLLDVILTLPMSRELSRLMNQLKDRIERSPQQAFQEYPFELEGMLQLIDGY